MHDSRPAAEIPAASRRPAIFTLRAAILAGFWAVAASVAIYVPPELNLRLDPYVVWFPLPTLAIAFLVLIKIRNNVGAQPRAAQYVETRLWIGIIALVVAAAALALFLNGWDRMQNGTVTLRGDGRGAPALFQTTFSLVLVVAAGLVEEATIRGLFQLRVTPAIGGSFAQVGALIVFLGFHGAAVTEPRQLIFLTFLGVVAGYVTSITRSVVAPAVFHAAVNAATVCVVLLLRP